MLPHSWTIEDVPGGPEGGGRFYRCQGCGCCGGCADLGSMTDRPFLPGPAMRVSQDCEEAQQQILYYVRGCIRALRLAQIRPKEVGIIERADLYTPSDHERVSMYSVVADIAYRGTGRWTDRNELKQHLVSKGYHLVSRRCPDCQEPTERGADDPREKCYRCAAPVRGGLA